MEGTVPKFVSQALRVRFFAQVETAVRRVKMVLGAIFVVRGEDATWHAVDLPFVGMVVPQGEDALMTAPIPTTASKPSIARRAAASRAVGLGWQVAAPEPAPVEDAPKPALTMDCVTFPVMGAAV